MKRFLSLLTVFVLAFSLAVPVGAVDDDMVLYNGYEYPDIETVWDKTVYPYAYIVDGYLYLTKDEPMFGGFDGGISTYATNWCWYGVEDGNWVLGDVGKNNTTVSQESGVQWVSFGEYYTKPISTRNCDGSSCPATDVNFDDICDDCGLTLAYNLRVTPNTYEVVVKHSDSLTLKYSYTETLAGTSFDAVYNDNRITVSFDNPVNHYQYKLVDGEWTDYASYPNQYGTHTISLSGDASILASDMDIYDSNGDLFFQNPLWMTVEKVTQGEMANLTAETAGTMKTLVVCGVGLMACLVALSLFGKRSLISLR